MLSVEQIMGILPHRYPFLMLDGALEVSSEVVRAFKHVTINEPHFQGHFPGRPMMPGVLIVEAMAQAGALMAHHDGAYDHRSQMLVFMSIEKARFHSPVVPGQRLDLEVQPLRKGSAFWRMKGAARVDGKIVAQAQFTAVIAPADKVLGAATEP